jgi:hypothetical protein
VKATEKPDIPSDWKSDEFFIPISKIALLDADLDSVVFSIVENALTISAMGGGQTKKATVKRRIESLRRNTIPVFRWGNVSEVDAGEFARLLRVVGCSALVKETKTEEEMRVNQVHFNPELNCASSNARYHASMVKLDGMALDISIVGSDIPLIRSFCSKLSGNVGLYHDKNRLYVVDLETESVFVMGRVAYSGSSFAAPTQDFGIEILINRSHLIDGLEWALAALNGTQRLSCEVNGREMKMSNGGEIFSIPVSLNRGTGFKADMPAKYLRSITSHLDSDNILMRFGHPDHPTLLEMSNVNEDIMQVYHYLHTMRGR